MIRPMRAKPALPRPPPSIYGVPGIPEALREVIEKQRDNIGNALCVLQCVSLAVAAREGEDTLDGPFFPAAVDAVVQMLARSHDALDPGTIERRLTGDEVLDA
jgi:hypothetical protein